MSLMSLSVKLLPHIPAIEIALFRSLISLAICWTILIAQGISIWGNNPRMLLLRGVLGAVSLILYFATLQKIPLASAVMLQYLSPVFTAIVAFAFLHEKLYKIQWLFLGISFAGVFLVQGFDDRIPWLYLVFGLGSALLAALAYATIRKLNHSEHPLVIVAYFPLLTIPMAGVPSAIVWVSPQGWDWFWLLSVGIFTQLAQTFMTQAFQAEEANRLASVNYVGVMFAMIWGLIFFDEVFNFGAVLGMTLVIGGVVLNLSFKYWYPIKEKILVKN
jgi:drug/metabolite transporter (DMT)-like permease